MNKKGFMFVETIATMTVLLSLLIILYTIFINLLQKQKTNAEYESYGDKMYLFYIKEEMIKNGNYFNENGEYLKDESVLDISSTDNGDLYHCKDSNSNTTNYCLKTLVVGICDSLEIKYVHKTEEGEIELVDHPIESNSNKDPDFLKYINTIHTCDKDSEKVVLFGKIRYGTLKNEHISYAHIGFPNYTD